MTDIRSFGTLTLVATPIGNLGDISTRGAEALRRAALICCEDTRHSSKLLNHLGIGGIRLAVCNEHTEVARATEIIELLTAGRDVALITDAGTPGISDPGMRIAQQVIAAGLPVTATPGPAAVIVALTVSGLDTTRFAFDGFLPRSGRARSTRLAEVAAERRTVVLYEAPHRVERTIADLADVCGGDRRVAIARELTKLHETVWRGRLADAGDYLAANSPRGEYVVVVEGAPAPPEATDDALLDELRRRLAGGTDRRQAVAEIATTHGVAKRRVYDLALKLKVGP